MIIMRKQGIKSVRGERTPQGKIQETFMTQGLQEHVFRKPIGSIIDLLRLRVHMIYL